MTLFKSRPGFVKIRVPVTASDSSGRSIWIGGCTASMMSYLAEAADLVESIETKRLEDEQRLKDLSKAGEPDPAAEKLFDQIIMSAKEIETALRKVDRRDWRSDAKKGVEICARTRTMIVGPLGDMMNAQWFPQTDLVENAIKKDWTKYSEVCQSVTSDMVAHLGGYTQEEDKITVIKLTGSGASANPPLPLKKNKARCKMS